MGGDGQVTVIATLDIGALNLLKSHIMHKLLFISGMVSCGLSVGEEVKNLLWPTSFIYCFPLPPPHVDFLLFVLTFI